jgi:homogentisate 1,2-dioxygenase
MSNETKGYMSGFGSEFATEALPGALPVGRNSPQRAPYGLYAEQLTATAFTMPRHLNRRSWLYRIRPSAVQTTPYERADVAKRWLSSYDEVPAPPNQLRWDPLPMPDANTPTDFIDGMVTMAGNAGCGIHHYAANRSMDKRFFYNADGELLIVPQRAADHRHRTGRDRARAAGVRGGAARRALPGAAARRPGARLRVREPRRAVQAARPGRDRLQRPGQPARLPHPGRGLRGQGRRGRDVAKFQGNFWRYTQGHSPLDVVAWHGNCAPYKYDLRRYNAIGSITYDHPDPSIFLVLHAPSALAGQDSIDFVVFAPRVLAMQDTFRPPWFHRNFASEYMGLIHGVYDAKAEGFVPGGSSLHNCMTGHGPDLGTFVKASNADLSKADYISDTMAFMFETPAVLHPTRHALDTQQSDYYKVWNGLDKQFDPNKR